MSVTEEQQAGSFRGLPFLMPSETKTGGKKTVTHEYPNSNRRFTEELGQIPQSFSMELIIKDSVNNRIQFEQALNAEGLGELVHPIYGRVQVQSTTYSVTSNQTKIGEFKFSVNFEQSTSNITPQPVIASSSEVSSVADAAQESIDNGLEAGYEDPTFSDGLESAASKLDEIFSDLSGQIDKVIGPIQDNVAQFTKVINTAQSGVLTLAQKGETVKQSLQAVYLEFLQVMESPQDALLAWQSLTEFGLDDLSLPTDTFKRLQTQNNTSLMNEHTRLNGLLRAYESVSYAEFTTDQQLLRLQEFLEETYISLLQDSITDVSDTTTLALDGDVRSAFATLRSTTNKVINGKLENIWRVVTIAPGLSSLALTSYRYYENLDNMDLLFSLNQDQNVSGLKDPITAVTK